MTSEDFRKSQGILTGPELYDFAKRLCEQKHIDPAKDFPKTSTSEVLTSAARRRMYIGNAANMLRRAIFLGATMPEVLCLSEYFLVVFDAVEKELDFRKCALELNVSAIGKKYGQSDFLSMDVTAEDLQRVIERDADYYGVPIKDIKEDDE